MMRTMIALSVVLGLLTLSIPIFAQQRTPGAAANDRGSKTADSSPSLEEITDRIVARERQEISEMRRYSPIIEGYLQTFNVNKDGVEVPVRDGYSLGTANFKKISIASIVYGPGLNHLVFLAEGLLQMAYMDQSGLDKKYYSFKYIRSEFLGEVRCLVFDVTAVKDTANRFRGRIWVEDQDYTIVRFNGGYEDPKWYQSGAPGEHFDSWRVNAAPGLWLPGYIFTQEISTKPKHFWSDDSYKAQVRFWGYHVAPDNRESEFAALSIDATTPIKDDSDRGTDRSPLEAERQWQGEAERNALDGLEQAGLVSPASPIDKTLETVVNNIVVTNNLDIEPEIHCRVATVGTFEMFSIGHTIVLSRGIVDAVPDEATLAVLLAQEIADVMVPKPNIDKFGFGRFDDIYPSQLPKIFSFRDTKPESLEIEQKALELIRKSPYANQLARAALFMKDLNNQAKTHSMLISPRFGNISYLAAELEKFAPSLEPNNLNQIAALPIGSRVKIDPWSDKAELLKPKSLTITSPREKLEFQITPFEPFLTRYPAQNSSTAPTELPAKSQ